jgi:hypothetical protein
MQRHRAPPFPLSLQMSIVNQNRTYVLFFQEELFQLRGEEIAAEIETGGMMQEIAQKKAGVWDEKASLSLCTASTTMSKL